MLDVDSPMVDPWNHVIMQDSQSVRVSDDRQDQVEVLSDAGDITVRSIKITTASQPKSAPAPIMETTSFISSSPVVEDSHTGMASVQSLPLVRVTGPESPTSSGRPPDLSPPSPMPPPSPVGTIRSERTTDRAGRRHSVIDSRTSNRLSGFFSNLMHRRDTITPSSSRSGREDGLSSPTPGSFHGLESRSSSPSPPARPITPPPSLSPPTLQELGLSLSVVTSDLSPAHFSTPPTSGTFLAPHYLLLCHAQGLDVLPLVSPPALQPYALVRRVSFKSVLVMEHRGVLVAIAGRRDGVRVYALEEVRRAVEWRLDVEIRREREKERREEYKRLSTRPFIDQREPLVKKGKSTLSPLSIPSSGLENKSSVKSSYIAVPNSVSPMSVSPSIPKPRSPTMQITTRDRPPPYTHSLEAASRPSFGTSVADALATPACVSAPDVVSSALTEPFDPKTAEWLDARSLSDEEAIDILNAGASGSEALDERTSSMPQQGSTLRTSASNPPLPIRSQTSQNLNRHRPQDLDLTLTRANTTSVIPRDPSPSPTLLTLRQALQQSPPNPQSLTARVGTTHPEEAEQDLDGDEEDEDEVVDERITLAQALMESRLPDLPPAGTRRPQSPILIDSQSYASMSDHLSHRTLDNGSVHSRPSTTRPERRRRRWSVLDGMFNGLPASASPSLPVLSSDAPSNAGFHASSSSGLVRTRSAISRPSSRPTAEGHRSTPPRAVISPPPIPPSPEPSSSSNRISRILSHAFGNRRSGDRRQPTFAITDIDFERKVFSSNSISAPAPPPKLEYVKLPGTKGAVAVKAVETAKKSFLAILCGENGEKVELFAGTYRTALGLSRTFILPDSPRSLELQLQGDDLVEVFLVFTQNVFGLEPATVRVREVRIGRAERRAARRRVREIRTGQGELFDTDTPAPEDEDIPVNVSIGVSISQSEGTSTRATNTPPSELVHTPSESANDSALAHAEELVALATAQMGPYTTFQQLSFAPKFPLATISDDYIIPPTYPDFLQFRAAYEPQVTEEGGDAAVDLSQVQFSPPGLPMPAVAPPSKWYYRDPKGVIHGPWKASLMQAWYKDGLLPPDLPVRSEDETEFMLLRDLRQQCVDPTQPFRTAVPPPCVSLPDLSDASKPLLQPTSLLAQPRHFGPPPLFYSSRGGHSTAIVDARGRSVLKGRLIWSSEDTNDSYGGRMGDIKRLEAFDVKDRSVIVAMRQGGLEAMDFGDALLRPADESRTVLPYFLPPPSNTNRRGPFVWRIGTPIASSTSSAAPLSSRSKGGFISRRHNSAASKSPGRPDFASGGDSDPDNLVEVLFLGRKGDEIYLCERNAGAFRILRLCPETS